MPQNAITPHRLWQLHRDQGIAGPVGPIRASTRAAKIPPGGPADLAGRGAQATRRRSRFPCSCHLLRIYLLPGGAGCRRATSPDARRAKAAPGRMQHAAAMRLQVQEDRRPPRCRPAPAGRQRHEPLVCRDREALPCESPLDARLLTDRHFHRWLGLHQAADLSALHRVLPPPAERCSVTVETTRYRSVMTAVTNGRLRTVTTLPLTFDHKT